MSIRNAMEKLVRRHQDAITSELGALEGRPFDEDAWERPGGGGGVTRVLQGGRVFEKAGVNVSVVRGELGREAAAAMGGGHEAGDDLRFFAAGISLVLHPANPMAPTVHANYRYFERGGEEDPAAWWFGGGSDLTPCYLFEEDAAHFHRTLKAACDRHDAAFYPRFKAWCDEYFTLPHRGEARGIGGIFFDDLHDRPAGDLVAFVEDAASAFLPSYLPVLKRRMAMEYGEAQKAWQTLRRGRYVEFNLLYDRGTHFGLRTGGRVESILMSLPLNVRWEYAPKVLPGSEEARLLDALGHPREWIGP